MAYDWNSFWGTFVQVSGALLGIIAAFIISRIIDMYGDSNQKSNTLIGLIRQYNSLLNQISKRDFPLVIDYNINQLLASEYENSTFVDMSDNDILSTVYKKFPDYKDDGRILIAVKRNVSAIQEFKNKPLGADWPYPIPTAQYDYTSRYFNESEQINNLRREAEALIEDFLSFIEDSVMLAFQLKYIKRILYILMISIPLLVVYPMHFLPLALNTEPRILFSLTNVATFISSLKGMALWLLFFVIEIMFGFIAEQVNELDRKRCQNITNVPLDYIKLNGYSKFFRTNE